MMTERGVARPLDDLSLGIAAARWLSRRRRELAEPVQ